MTDEFVVETVSNLESDNDNDDLDQEMPLATRLEHLHSIYIAMGTLLSAIIIVGAVVSKLHEDT